MPRVSRAAVSPGVPVPGRCLAGVSAPPGHLKWSQPSHSLEKKPSRLKSTQKSVGSHAGPRARKCIRAPVFNAVTFCLSEGRG